MVSAATSKWLSDIPVRDLARTSSATKTASNDLNHAPECSRYEDILVRSPAFKWLCASILKELTLQRGPFRSFSNTVQEALDSNELVWIIRFRFQWDLAGFLTHEYGDKDQTLGEVITITGTPDSAQAVTCSTYLHQVWPCVGPEILCAIQDAFRRHGESQGVTEVCDLHLLYGKTRPTKFTAQFQPNTSAFWFDVKGTKEAISEAVEVVAWIVGALRSSDHDTGIFIRPEIGKITYDTDGMKALHIKYARLTPLSNEQGQMAHSPILQNGICWQAMFRNPVVVSEFPILRRPRSLEHSGLEISFDMMASLVQAPRLTQYAGRQYLKGFSSMLVAVKKTDGIVLWHHYYNPSGGRVSYSDAASRESPDCQQISIEDILAARHIIGWCNHAQFRAGDPAIACGSIRPSGLPLPSRKVLLEKITLSAGSTVTAGVSFAIGEKDKPIHISRDSYLLKLKWVHQKSVVLWDVADKRGWLLNGIDALFHLLRNSLESCRTDKFNSLFLFDFSLFKIYTEANKVSAILTLGDHNNRKLGMYVRDENPHTSYITLQDKVEELIGTLERMFDHQSEVRTSKGINANVRLRRRLQGWDFCDLALGRDLDLREASLTMDAFSWVDFVKEIGAVTLLGKGFGELIVPAPGSSRASCQNWAAIPKGKYYLCAGVDDILHIAGDLSSDEKHEDTTVKLLRLTRQRGWLNPSPRGHPFSACPCSTRDSSEAPSNTNCCPVQFVVPATTTKLPRLSKMQHRIMPSHLEESRNGAVIFGQGLVNLIRRLWPDDGVDQIVTVSLTDISAQPNDSFPDSNQQVLNMLPPDGSGSDSGDSATQMDRMTPSPTANPSHPSSCLLVNNGGKSQVFVLSPPSRLGSDEMGEPIDMKQKGTNVIRQRLGNLVVGNR
ncbi:hypothetical protein QBC32DRAFT_170328 [Pseudoneurospora amorphoporcata]|uniref:Uncharacterized protein n=1 Tax=Pseudoneurospora amorphoporcata TaxID=241081 RepID=A0AAN6NU85_9PEZI|nr:hypothetical protein QBC32DRAFT_170328 [Pseudoneurospora amorphoporcata]